MKNSYIRKYGDKLLFILAISLLAAILYHLQGKKTAGGQIFQADNPAILFTQWWEGDMEKDSLGDLIKEFENLHEGIKVILRTESYEDLREELYDNSRELLQGDDNYPGDIIALDPLWIPDLLMREKIENPGNKDYDSSITEKPDGISPPAPYGVPGTSLISSINVLYYNADILKDAGFSRPPKTRGEFLTYCRAIAKDKENLRNVYGLAYGGKSPRFLNDDIFPWIWSAGIEVMKSGKPDCNSKAVIESLSFLAALQSEGFIPPHALSADTSEKLEQFMSGRAAFMIAPASEINHVRERMGDEQFSVTSVPIPDNYAGISFYGIAGWTVGINQASLRKEEARIFAGFIAEKAPALFENSRVSIPASNTLQPQEDTLYFKVWDITIACEPANDFTGLPWVEMETIFREELYSLLGDKKTPAETAGAIQRRWEAILDSLQ